jgi:hypothetical protein
MILPINTVLIGPGLSNLIISGCGVTVATQGFHNTGKSLTIAPRQKESIDIGSGFH